jgi:hypothetical protein
VSKRTELMQKCRAGVSRTLYVGAWRDYHDPDMASEARATHVHE